MVKERAQRRVLVSMLAASAAELALAAGTVRQRKKRKWMVERIVAVLQRESSTGAWAS